MKNYLESFVIAFFIFFTVFYLSASYSEEYPRNVKNNQIVVVSNSSMQVKNPPCIELHNCIEKYSEEYKIPKNIAYGVAFSETRYEGPTHWNYSHEKSSGAGALGPMQVMYSTAKGLFPDKIFSRAELMSDIDFNVHCSMKLLKKLFDKYSSWKVALGAYNTGTPCINGYAEKVFKYQL
jgi:soluble lytic murein transglycosylase-like protein